MNASPQPPVAAAVVVKERRVLLVRRRRAEGDLSWQFPAGKVESGESPAEAAAREAREESGVLVVPFELLGERTHPMTGRRIFYFGCEAIGGTAHPADTEEIADIAWATLAEIPQYVPYGLFEPVQRYLDAVLPD
ncbi:NUDIX hydrolase [Streptomyces sp. NPDC087659]|uniref:NUDIX hydrolase n=1 Tax=Streptomyces sp. NPDC087659 TaxID=3365801 RepID=UPI00382F7AC8